MATAITGKPQTHPISYYWGMVKNLDDNQKLELVSIIIDSIRNPNKSRSMEEENFTLRPFTQEELDARLDAAEANIAAGNVIDSEDVWRELEEEFACEDAEENARKITSNVETEQLATV
jgi:hypothetical protein